MSIAAIDCAGNSLSSDYCADEIEQRIIRAYVQLLFGADNADGSRSVTVTRLGLLEVRLTELPPAAVAPGMPPFWLEVFHPASQSPIECYGCFEFDETELASAVDLVLEAARQADSRDFPPLQ
jgi:hypothetical protein